MSLSFVRKFTRQFIMLLAVMLILFAAYLSIGRQFMPAVSRYKELVEQQIYEAGGIPVTIESLSGHFEGFSPAIVVYGLQVQVLDPETNESAGAALQFDNATMLVDMTQTLLQRQLVLKTIIIEDLDVRALQTADGNWQLLGLALDSYTTFDPDAAYNIINRVSRLELNDLDIELQTLRGNVTRFNNSTALIQNFANNHYIHINTTINDNDQEALFSVEVSGDRLDEIAGTVHASLPDADYSSATENEVIGNVRLGEIIGGGEGWATFRDGEIESIVFQPRIRALNFGFDDNPFLSLSDITGTTSVQQDLDSQRWQLITDDIGFDWQGRPWRGSDIHALYQPGETLELKVQTVYLDTMSNLIQASGIAPDGLQNQLAAYQPAGILRNLLIRTPIQENSAQPLTLTANTDNVALLAAGGVPAMTGINGFVEMDFNFATRQLNGAAEVDSENFSIWIPKLWDDTWDYDYVNGRVRFQVDLNNGTRVQVASSLIVAESLTVDGHAQFSLTIDKQPDKEDFSDFSLLVGGLRVDGSLGSKYMPTAVTVKEGLRGAMQWLDSALIDAAVTDSGIMFRGTLGPDRRPQEKSFQSFFNFKQGTLKYLPQWPQLSALTGAVIIDNQAVDIAVSEGESLGLVLDATHAQLRTQDNGDTWLSIGGSADGTVPEGINFLKTAPISDGLTTLLDSWEAQGLVDATIGLRVPLNNPTLTTAVRVDATMKGASLDLPDYQLTFDEVAGKLHFDSDQGLRSDGLDGVFFGQDAAFTVASSAADAGGYVTTVAVEGRVDSQELAHWQGQSQFVREILLNTEGVLNYSGNLVVNPTSDQGVVTKLDIRSDLEGLTINFPPPFQKQGNQSLPLNLGLEFNSRGMNVNTVLGSVLSLRVSLDEASLPTGIVYLGTLPGTATPWQSGATGGGLEIRGDVDRLNMDAWIDTFTSSFATSNAGVDLNSLLARVDVNILQLEMMGQSLDNVTIEIPELENEDYWTVSVVSDAVTGSVLFPNDQEDYIQAYLAFLRLPGSTTESADNVNVDASGASENDTEAVDVLAGLDPRKFPALKFYTGEFSVGERNYGFGQFTLDPTEDGAEFSNLVIDFRGFNIGLSDTEPHFGWHYDGRNHHSYLTGEILAGNLADVLRANGYAPSLESSNARFDSVLDWPGSPAFFKAGSLRAAPASVRWTATRSSRAAGRTAAAPRPRPP